MIDTNWPMIPSLAVRRAAPALSVLLLAGSAAAQKSDVEVAAEIEFARGLAADWSFVDLAEEVIQGVEADGVSSRMSEQLGLVKCDVYAIGARNERDATRRNQLFDQALDAYESFIGSNPRSDERPAAEVAFVDTAAAYARFLTQGLEEAVGEDADALRERQIEVLTDAVDKTSDLISSLQTIPTEERSEKESRQLFDLMLNRGEMLKDIGRNENDGAFFYDQAIQALENLVFEAGEGTPYSLRAYIAMGNVYAERGQHDEAAAFFEAVVDQTIPTDADRWSEMSKDMTQGEIDLRFLFLERAIPGLTEAYSNTGDLETALGYAMHFVNFQRSQGLTLSPFGHLAQVSVAKVLMDAGGYVGGDLAAGEAQWFETLEAMKDAVSSRRNQRTAIDVALRFAQTVNEENKGNVLQVRAQKLMSEIITRPGVEVSPEILFEAAEGEYLDQNYAAALTGFRKVLKSLQSQDQATRIEYGARVMYSVGNCYRRMDRTLEAAMAYREGATTWLGDPSFDSKNAQGYYNMITSFARGASNDKAAVETLVSEAERIVAAEGAAKKDEVLFNLGKKAEREKDFDKALSQYAQVEQGSEYFEKAMVQTAVVKLKSKDSAGALSALQSYLGEYLNDPKNASTDPTYLAKRKEAKAAAEFYRGFIQFNAAEASKDQAGYRQVVDNLANYFREYPEQSTLAPWTMQMVIASRLALDERTEAKALLEKLSELYPDAKQTGQASVQFYKALESKRDETTDPEAKLALIREMAELLQQSNSVATSPSFTNLRRESQHWIELKEWATAEALLRRIATKFEGDPAEADSLRRYVLPDLGAALLEQKKVTDAKDILGPLVNGEGSRASRATVLNWCRSVIGWLEGEGSNIEVVLGAGTGEDFAGATDKLNAIAASGDKWTSCDWYEHKFMYIYGLYVWSQEDSAKLESAKKQIGNVAVEAGSDFATVNEFCDADDTEEALRGRLGNRVLQDRYRWLASKL